VLDGVQHNTYDVEFYGPNPLCGVYDLGWRAKVAVTGEDRVRWLNGMVTNNIRDLAPGNGNYNFLLNAKGHILADLYIYAEGSASVKHPGNGVLVLSAILGVTLTTNPLHIIGAFAIWGVFGQNAVTFGRGQTHFAADGTQVTTPDFASGTDAGSNALFILAARVVSRLCSLVVVVVLANALCDQLWQPSHLCTDNPPGPLARLVASEDAQDEAELVTHQIGALVDRRLLEHPGDSAVLYRTNAQSRAMEEAFRRAGVPYRLIGAISFYERREVKDLLAYLRLVANPSDDEAFLRAVGVPRRGLGETSLALLGQVASQWGKPLLETARIADRIPDLRPNVREAFRAFAALIDGAARLQHLPPADLLEHLIRAIDSRPSSRPRATVCPSGATATSRMTVPIPSVACGSVICLRNTPPATSQTERVSPFALAV